MRQRDKSFSSTEDLFDRLAQQSGRLLGDGRVEKYIDQSTGARAGSAAARGICRYLKVAMWRSEGMYRLRGQGDAQLLYLYLITGPHTLSCHVPGIYQVGRETIREELSLKLARFNRALLGVTNELAVETDFNRSLVFAPTALDHIGPPANPNIVRSYCQVLSNMPASILVEKAIRTYGPFLASLGPSFLKPFRDRFSMVWQSQPKSDAMVAIGKSQAFGKETETETETETERETEISARRAHLSKSAYDDQKSGAEADRAWYETLRQASTGTLTTLGGHHK